MLNAKMQVAIAVAGMLACGSAVAATSSPNHLRCTVVGTWDCAARYASATAQSRTTARRPFVGHYYLSGVREVGSELLLRPDGSFAWSASFGAVDQAAEGKWQTAGQAIVLDAATGAGRRPAFTQLRLAIDGAALRMPDGEGRYVRQP